MKKIYVFVILFISLVFTACSSANKKDKMLSSSPIFKIQKSSSLKTINIIEQKE